MKQNSLETPKAKADISFEVGYKNDKTRFDLRFISVAEETMTQNRFAEIADETDETLRTEKEYAICVDALCGYSQRPEDGTVLRQKFAEMTVTNERIIRSAYQQFRLALSPEVSFL